MPRAHLTIRGRVQGVWFRGALQREARRLGLRGWARNCADGSVECEVEGERAAVDQAIAWAQHGPPGAQVSDVTVTWIASPDAPEHDFVIRR